MTLEYRGFRIRLVDTGRRCALLVEAATGALLPTKIDASPDESLGELANRARRLADLYAGDRREVPVL